MYDLSDLATLIYLWICSHKIYARRFYKIRPWRSWESTTEVLPWSFLHTPVRLSKLLLLGMATCPGLTGLHTESIVDSLMVMLTRANCALSQLTRFPLSSLLVVRTVDVTSG